MEEKNEKNDFCGVPDFRGGFRRVLQGQSNSAHAPGLHGAIHYRELSQHDALHRRNGNLYGDGNDVRRQY